MSVNKAARAYAKALFDLAHGKNESADALKQLHGFLEAYSGSEDLQKVLTSSQVSASEKMGIAAAVCGQMELTASVSKFMQLLAEKNRVIILAEITTAFEALVDEHLKILRGVVTTSDIISVEQVRELEKAFTKKLGKTVLLKTAVESSLLGGLVVKIGDLTFDGSMKTALQNIKHSLERQYI